MKYFHKISIALPAVALSLALAACSDDNEYTPGAPESPDCAGVYFDTDNERDFIFVPGEPATIDIKLHRSKGTEAVDIPLVVTSDVEGLDYPPTIHFDAGSSDAEVSLDCSALPQKQLAKISVTVPEEYIDHYAATLFNYETTALISSWEPANTDGSPVKFYFTNNDYAGNSNQKVTEVCYEPIECEMEVLPGASMIRIHNFMNIGADVVFTLSESPYGGDFEGAYRLTPDEDHYYLMSDAYESDEYGDPYNNAWYLMTDDFDYSAAELTDLSGNPSTLDGLMFYWYSDAYAYEYCYMRPKATPTGKNSASMYLYGEPVGGTVILPSYFYLYFSWDGDSSL